MKLNRRTVAKGAITAGAIGMFMPSALTAHDAGTATPDHDHDGHGHGSGTGAVFMEITNNGDEADTLIAAKTDVAEIVEIHTMVMDGDVMKMKELEDGLEIPAEETVTLESGGYHVMLINLTQDLHDGDEYTLNLEFENAGEVEIDVVVSSQAPDDASVTVDEIEIAGAFTRPAPMLGGHDGTPQATPDSH